MKNFIFLFSIVLTLSLQAQPRGGGVRPPQAPHAPVLVLQAAHGELFYVYVDGSLYLRDPMAHVELKGLDRSEHDVFVVLHRPAQKIVYMSYRPEAEPVVYQVHYCAHEDALKLLPQQHLNCHTASAFSSRDRLAQHLNHEHSTPPMTAPAMVLPPLPRPAVATYAELQTVLGALKRESFDSDRLAVARSAMENKLFTAEQIKRLATSFEFESNKVTFLTDAYDHCFDQENYFKVVQVLNFSLDREKVLEAIKKN